MSSVPIRHGYFTQFRMLWRVSQLHSDRLNMNITRLSWRRRELDYTIEIIPATAQLVLRRR